MPTVLIAVVLGLLCGCDKSPRPRNERLAKMGHCLAEIGTEIVDLTSIQEPLANKKFAELRDGMTLEEGALIVELLTNKHLSELHADLAVMALTGLSESNYWKLTAAILKTSLEDRHKELVLDPYCYGPGYARAFRDPASSNELVHVRALAKSGAISNLVDRILCGDAEKDWRAVLDEPDAFGWNPEYLKRFRPY